MGLKARIAVVVALVVIVGLVIVSKQRPPKTATAPPPGTGPASSGAPERTPESAPPKTAGVPRLIEIGSVTCIPCKMMAPILDELRKEYAGRLQVDFIDVNKDREAATAHSIRVIPTQVFLDASGKEVFRHEGFFPKEDILAKLKELGVNLKGEEPSTFQRMTPAQPDTRPKESVCYMCDGDIQPKTLVSVRTDKGEVRLCSPHCFFIMYSCLTQDKTGFEKTVSVADYATGKPVPATDAVYLCGLDAKKGRPWVKAFADQASAE